MATFKDEYLAQKKKGSAASLSFQQQYKAQKTDFETLAKEVSDRTNTWLKNHSTYVSNYCSRYETNIEYRDDSSDWYATVSQQKQNFDAEAKNINSLLDKYSGIGNDEWDNFASQIKNILATGEKDQSIVTMRALQDRDFASQFASREDYNRWDMGWLSEDATADYGSAQKRKAYYEKNQSRIAEIDTELKDYTAKSRAGLTTKEEEAMRKSLKAEKESLEAENRRYENEQKNLDDYYKPETEEFKENAAYRNYRNISVGDTAGYGVDKDTAWNTLSNGGYWDQEGNLRDKDGNVVGKSEDSFSFAMEDKLGAYLNTSAEDRVAIQDELQKFTNADPLTTYQNMIFEAENGSWDQLTEGEINIYYDLYKTQGQEAAYKYLSDMKDVLNKRATQEKQEDIRNSEGWEQFGWNVASIPMNVIGGATAFVDDAINVLSGNDVNPYSKAHLWQNMGQAVREETAKDWDEATGNIAVPWLDFSAGDVYQSFMSAADSVGGALTFGKGYSVLMGMGAASSKARELYERGASRDQIIAGSLLAGAAEIVFESIGIDGLLKAKNAKNLKDVVSNALKQSGVEAFEETGTEIANAISEVLVMDTQSKYGTLDWGDASTFASDVVNAALGGFISGGMGGGTIATVGSAMQAADYQNAVKAHGQAISDIGGVESLQKHAEAMIKDKNTPNAWEIKQQLKKTQKNSSAKNVGNLYGVMQESVSKQNRKELVQQLKKEGLTKWQADSVYDAILQMDNSISRAGSDTARLAAEQKFVDTLAKMGLDDATQSAVATVAQDLMENPQNASQSRLRDLMNARVGTAPVDPEDIKTLSEHMQKEIKTEGRVSSDGKAYNSQTGEQIAINEADPIAKIVEEDGERVVYLNTDQGEVQTSDIEFASEDDLYLYEYLSALDAGTASVVVQGYKDSNMPVLDYVQGMTEGILLYGKHNFQSVGKDISEDGYFAGLSEADRQTALKLGRELRAEETRQKTERVRKAIERAKEEKRIQYDAAPVNKEIVSLVEKGYEYLTKPSKEDKVSLGVVSDEIATEIEKLTGVNVEGFEIMVEARQLAHILKRHGENGKADSSMKNPADIAKMEYVLDNPDDISYAGKTNAYWHNVNGKNKTADTVLYEKNIGEKSYYVVQAVPDTKAKALYVVTAFIGKVGQKKEALLLTDAESPGATSKNVATNASISSIPQNSEIVKTEGKVFFDDSVELSELTKKQRAEVEYAGNVISAVIGNEIHFFDSRHVPADSREAKTNGWYDPTDGSIHLDIAKMESGEESVLFSLSHELVHFIEDWSPAKYQTFADFLLKNYAEHGVSTRKLLERKMAELKTDDADYAMSELVADACERMLLDSKASEKLAELNKTDKGLVQKIKSFLKNTLKKIRQVYAQFKGREEAQLLQKMEDKLSEFHALFEDALTDAAQNYRDADGKLDVTQNHAKDQLKKSFANDIDLWLQGQYKRTYFDLGTTPDIFVKHGARHLPVIMTEEVLSKVTGGKHAISLDEIKKLPEQLNDPVLLFKGSRPASFVVLTELKDKSGTDVICAVHLERSQDRIRVNRIASLYGKDNISDYVSRNISDGNLLDASAKKAPTWLTSRGLQLPKLVQDIVDANNSIPQKNGSVNTSISENAKKDSIHEQKKLTTNRDILTNVDLETADLSKRGGQQLKSLIENYQTLEKELKQHEAKVRSLSEDILKLKHSKNYNVSDMDELLKERNREQIRASQIRRDLQLIVKAPVVDAFLQKEKLAVYRANRDEIERGKMERTRVTELKRRARKKAETLNSMLTKPTKKVHVKSGLQKAVASFLDAINLDTVNYEARIKYLETRLKFAEQEIEAELKRSGITKENAAAFEEQFAARVEKRIKEITASKEWNDLRNMSMFDKVSDLRKGLAAYMEEENIAETPNRKMILEILDKNSVFLEASAKQRIEDLKAKIEGEEDPVERAYLSVRLEMLNQQKDFLPLGAMSLGELQVVNDSISQVLAMVRDANKVFDDRKAMEAAEASETARLEIKQVKKPRAFENGVRSLGEDAFWSILQPDTAFQLIGSDTLVNLFDDLVDGSHQWGSLVDRAHRYFVSVGRKYDWLKWRNDKTLYTFESTNQKTFQLNLQEVMALYAYYRRGEQAINHIVNGGIVKQNEMIPATKKSEKDGKEITIPFGYKPESNTPYKISRGTLDKIFQEVFEQHPEAKKYVEEMQRYLSEDCSEQGNKTSMILYGIRLFKEKIYFPIRTWSRAEAFDPDAGGDSMIVNASFTKSTMAGATRAIVLDNFDSVWAKHVDEMARYATMSVPVENFHRVWNVKAASDLPTNDFENLSTVIQSRWGKSAVDYVEKYLSDINGGARGKQSKDPLKKAMSLSDRAAVIASLSVAIQQPSSVARAAAYIDPKYFVSVNLKNIKFGEHQKRWEELKKYAPVAITKEMGRFDADVGVDTAEWILSPEYDKITEKAWDILHDPHILKRAAKEGTDVLSRLPSLMDEISWGKIWYACRRQIAAEQNLDFDSEQCKIEAGKLFTTVINRTQVYDSTMVRSQMMRNDSLGAKWLTRFFAEPTTTVNMHLRAGIEAARNGKAGRKFFHRTNLAILASKIINAALVAIIYAIRDDDEDEALTEKYAQHFIEKFLDEMNPLTHIPILRDFVSVAEGWSIERPDTEMLSDLIYSTKQWSSDEKTVYEKLRGTVQSVSTILGLPVKNIWRDVEGICKTLFSGLPKPTKQGLMEAMYEALPFTKKTNKSEGLYEAYVSGDAAQIDRYRDNYDTEEKWTTAVRTALKENDPRIQQAAIAQLNGNASERVRIQKEIIGEGNFSQDLIVTATNGMVTSFQSKIRTASEAKKAGKVEEYEKIIKELQEAEYPDELISKYVGAKVEALQKEEEAEAEQGEKAASWYKSSDIADAYASGDEKLALEIIDDLIRVKTANSTEEKAEDKEKAAKSSVKSLVTEYWKPRYKEAYKKGNQEEMKRIRYILKDTGLYGSVNDLVKTCNRWLSEKE